MKRVKLALVSAVLALVTIGVAQQAPPGFDVPRREPVIHLWIEPLLIEPSGIHPLQGATAEPTEVGDGGAQSMIIKLGGSGDRRLLFKLGYEALGTDHVRLTLDRSIFQGKETLESLPPVTHTLGPLDSWTTTVLEDTRTSSRIDLRVVTIIRPRIEDIPFDSGQFFMHMEGGPLIEYRYDENDEHLDQVIFREVNTGGTWFRLGIKGVGLITLGLRQFPGSTACGRIQGHEMSFEIGSRAYAIYSLKSILPDDPARPGGGWILYGKLDPKADVGRGFYGSAPAP